MAADEREKPTDLRHTQREDQGVRLTRDLSGQGHLARGSSTNMSRLSFSVQAKPRDYRDPELEALRPATVASPAPAPDATTAAPEPTAEREPGDASAAEPEPPAPPSDGVFAAIKRLFS